MQLKAEDFNSQLVLNSTGLADAQPVGEKHP
jgi:hypothetical protein